MGTLQGPLPLGILLFILAYTSASPACNLGCNGSPGNLFNYEAGTNYKYKLEGTSETRLADSPGQVAKLGLSATADISALPNCVYVLKISDVHLTGTDGKSQPGGKELETQPIRFSMNNGKVESELCSGGTGGGGRSETHAALNIKRAVLSLLQSSANIESGRTYLRETDIFGTCPTSYDVSKQGDKMTVRKHRPLNECVHREEVVLPFSTTPYAVNSDMQSNPEIEASMVTEQEIESGVVKSAMSKETYKYGGVQPESGPTVTVKTHLTLVSHAKGAPPIPAAGNERRSIMFELPHQKDGEVKMDVLIENLKKACESSLPHVHIRAASDFRDLVRMLANAKKSDILAFYNKAKSGSVCSDRELAKKLALDAILNAESSVSVEAMAELIIKKEVTGMKSKYWLLRMGMARHLNKGSLKAVLPLLEGEPSTEAYLGVGMLVGRFCRAHRCQGVKEVEQLEAKMAAPLANCHPDSRDQEDHLIASIKALGNTHYLTSEVAAKLSACAADKTVRTRVRVAALEAMRTDPKKDECKNTASLLLKNLEEDSEVRIKAYLVVAENPTSKSAELIKDVLDNEKVFQVGNFIVSHLRNIRSSTNPDKENAKHHFGNIKTNKRFPFDFRKYSMNNEFSYSLDGINMGASAESNLIYSQKSYIPRSLSLNLTTQIFGHAFNFLELDLRTENLERRIERWFAPKGYLNTKDPNEIEEMGRKEAKELYDTFLSKYKKAMRVRRTVARDQLEALEKKAALTNTNDETADIDVSMKVHGAEVAWFNYHLTDSPINKEKIMDGIFNQMSDSVDKAKDFDIDYNKHSTFIDMEVAYPTGLGLPLRLKVIANSAIKLKMNGKFDVPSMIKDPKNIDIKFQLLPSAVVDIIGDLTVDGEVIETGLRMSASVHTATGSDLSLNVLQGKQVDIKLGVPMDNQEVISMTTDVLSLTTNRQGKEHLTPVDFNTKRMEKSGCFDQLESVTGLIFCGTVSTPWEGSKTFLPTFGKSKFSLKVSKQDTSLTHYHARASYNTGDDNSFEVYFETPNTKEKRRISAGLSYGLNNNKYLKIDLESPWYYAHFNSKLVNTDQEKLISASLNMSGPMEYGLQIGAKVSGTPDNRKFTPFFKYSVPAEAPKLVGKKGGDKPKDTYQVKGSFTAKKQGEREVFNFNDLSLTIPRATYKLNGQVATEPQFIEGNLAVTAGDKGDKVFSLKGSYDGRSDEKKSAKLEFAPQAYPDFGINLSWNLHNKTDENDKSVMKSTLVVVHGPDPNSAETRVTIENHLELCEAPMHVKTENHVSYPVFNIDGRADFMMNSGELKTHLNVQANEYKGGSTFHAKIGEAHKGDYSVEFNANLMDKSVDFETHHTVTGEHKSNFGTTLKFHTGKEYTMKADVVRKFLEDDMDFHVDSEIKLPFKPHVLNVVAGAKHNPAECHGLFNMKADSNLLIGFDVKSKTDGGYLNVNLPGHLNVDGKYTLENNHMKGNAKATFPKADREMNAAMDIEVADPNYNGVIDFCWDTKDPKKSLKIETNSVLEKDSIQTKNVLHLNEYVTKFNAKGKTTGTFTDGTISGEAEIVLPNDHQLSAKFSRSLHMKGDAFDGEFIGEFTGKQKDSEPRKFNVKLVGKNVNVEKGLFDGTGSMSYVSPSKKDFHLNGKIKNVHPDTSKWKLDGEFGASGSYLDHPMNLKFETELDGALFDGKFVDMGKIPPYSYHVSSSYGPNYSFNSNGKGKGNMFSCEMSFNLPEGHPVQSVKWSSSNFVDVLGKDTPRKVKTNTKLSWNTKEFINFNGEVCEEDNGANFNFDWESHDESKRALSGAVHCKGGSGEPYVGDMSVALSWDSQTADLTIKAELDERLKSSSWHILGQTPQIGKFDISTKAQARDGNGFYGEVSATVKDKTTTGTAKVEFNEGPYIDLVLDHDGKKSTFFHKMVKKNPKHYASETKLHSAIMKSLNYESDVEINYESMDSFMYKVNVHCPALKIDKVQVDLSSRPSAGKTPGKKLMISVTKANAVVISGSTSYTVKENGDTKTVEGTGNLKYYEEELPLKFKLVSEPYKEKGRKVSLESNCGKYKFNVNMERGPSHFLFQRTICKDASKCSTAIMQYSSSGKGTSYKNTIKMQLDFSFFNPEFSDFYFLWNNKLEGIFSDNKFEMKWSENGKIEYHNFVTNETAGFKLVLPKRTVAGEINYDHKNGKIEGSLWLDRERSPKRTHLVLQSSSDMDKDSMTMSGSAALSHPALKKKLQISGKLSLKNDWTNSKSGSVDGSGEIDIFNDPSEKINVVLKASMSGLYNDYSAKSLLSVNSEGCGINMKFDNDAFLSRSMIKFNEQYSYIDSKNQERKAVFSSKLTPSEFKMLMKLPDFTLMDITYKIEKDSNPIKVIGTVDIAGSVLKETYQLSTKPSLKYQLKLDKVGGEKLFNVDAGVENEKGVATVTFDNSKIVEFDVDLSEKNFLKTTFNHHSENFKKFYEALVKSGTHMSKSIEKGLQSTVSNSVDDGKFFLEKLQNALPNFQPVLEAYGNQLKAMKDELAQDETIKSGLAYLKRYMNKGLEAFVTILEEISSFFESMISKMKEGAEKLSEAMRKSLQELEKSVARIGQLCVHVMEEWLQFSLKIVDLITKELKKYEEDLNIVLDGISLFTHAVGKAVFGFAREFYLCG